MVCVIASEDTLLLLVLENVPDNFILPTTSSFWDVAVPPIITLPILSITNWLESGVFVSSTTNELPVPVWVNLTKSVFADANAINNGVVRIIFPSSLPVKYNLAPGALAAVPIAISPYLPILSLSIPFAPNARSDPV